MNLFKSTLKNDLKSIIKIFRLILSRKLIFLLFLYFAISLLATFGELVSTYLISNYISSSLYIDISNNLNYFAENPQIILFIVFLSALARLISIFILPRLTTYISTRITSLAFKKYYVSSLEDKEIYSFNEIQTTFSVRSSQLTGGVVYTILNIINNFLIFLLFLSFLLITEPLITFILILSVISLYTFSALIFRKNLRIHSRIMNTYNQFLITFIDSSLRDQRYAAINLNQSKVIEEYKLLDFKLRNSSTQITFLSSTPKILIECLFFVGLLLFAILFTNIRGNSISNFPNLIILLACFQRLIPSLQGIYSYSLSLKANLPALKYFLDFINTKSEEIFHDYFGGEGKIENIIFNSTDLLYRYKNNKILRFPKFKVFRGEFVIIKGISGKGKTTWIDLLLGLRTPFSGSVKRNFELSENIYLNFNVGKEDITKIFDSYFYKFSKLSDYKNGKNISKNKKLMKICGIDFLNNDSNIAFPKLKNKRLSSGQYQRIQLFVALSLNPKILILDEALNAIELELEHQIIRNIKREFGSLTLIQITHRPYQEEFYNRVYNLE